MFKKSRRKIVVAIMSILVLLWVGTLGTIYASSYFEMEKQNREMLQEKAERYNLPQASEEMEVPKESETSNKSEVKEEPPKAPEKEEGPEKELPDNKPESPKVPLSTFYTVAVSYDGEILEIKNDSPTIHSDEELKELAQHIIEGNKNYGTNSNLAFYKADKNEYHLVVFKDNTVINEGAATLFHHTLIFGGITLVLFFFLSVLLARKIVAPLEESYQKQKQFISDAGHELKTPVAIVSANAELLSHEMGDNQWLQNIQYENERMGILVGQLLDLARTENVVPQMEHIDFSRLVAGGVLPFESVAFEKGLVLNSDITNDIGVEGNSTQLKQIVSILLDNAIRYSKEKGEVRLTLTKEHGFAKLSVINKGDEIPAEESKKIFERFYRLDTARNGEDKHYGLGLAIAKAIVTSHKGHIEVNCSHGLVEFRVKLPAF